jgi:hypothetical protein
VVDCDGLRDLRLALGIAKKQLSIVEGNGCLNRRNLDDVSGFSITDTALRCRDELKNWRTVSFQLSQVNSEPLEQ